MTTRQAAGLEPGERLLRIGGKAGSAEDRAYHAACLARPPREVKPSTVGLDVTGLDMTQIIFGSIVALGISSNANPAARPASWNIVIDKDGRIVGLKPC